MIECEKIKEMKRKKKQSLRGMGGWVDRDEKEDKNKRKRMLKCGVRVGCNWDMRLGRRERVKK